MKKVTAIILVAVFLLTAVAFADEMQVAQAGRGRGREKAGHGRSMNDPIKMQRHTMRMHKRIKSHIAGSFFLLPMIQKELNLNDKQVEKLEKMRADYAKKMIDKRADIAKARVDMSLLMSKFNQDIPSIERIMQKISNMQVSMRVDRLKAFEQAKSVLTPDQKTKLEQFWKGEKCPSTRMKQRKQEVQMRKRSENTPEESSKSLSWFEYEEIDEEEIEQVE